MGKLLSLVILWGEVVHMELTKKGTGSVCPCATWTACMKPFLGKLEAYFATHYCCLQLCKTGHASMVHSRAWEGPGDWSKTLHIFPQFQSICFFALQIQIHGKRIYLMQCLPIENTHFCIYMVMHLTLTDMVSKRENFSMFVYWPLVRCILEKFWKIWLML